MPNQSARLNRVFRALSDPTRRAVLKRLCRGSLPTLELARPFGMSLPSFTQHLGVLERSGLVTSRKSGRVRTYELAPRSLRSPESWLSEQRRFWERRLDELDVYLKSMKEAGNVDES